MQGDPGSETGVVTGLTSLRRQVFITDQEFESVFGRQVAEAVALLDRHADAVCAACRGECCRRIGCGFYSPAFRSCPIFEFRPAKCRLYYCEKVLDNERLTEQERQLLSQPARELSRIVEYSYGLEVLLKPPIRIGEADWLAALGIDAETRATVQALETGAIDSRLAEARLKDVVKRCRAQSAIS